MNDDIQELVAHRVDRMTGFQNTFVEAPSILPIVISRNRHSSRHEMRHAAMLRCRVAIHLGGTGKDVMDSTVIQHQQRRGSAHPGE
jgi:hypothetical protein